MSVIIYPPTIDWFWMKQRPQHFMRQLASSGHTVYYCNRTQSEPFVEELEPHLFLVHNHAYWLRHEWPAIRRRLCEPVGVWSSVPFHTSDIRNHYSPDWIVYDCADEFLEWIPYEQKMAEAADLIVCSSERLHARLRRSYPGKRIRLVRNGYDPEMKLHEAYLDRESASDTGKRQVGFVGAWAPWIDVPLVRELCALPDVEVVVIGPEFGRTYDAATSTIRFLGLKPHEQLASYLLAFSVCIIPFRIIPVTLAANPVKAYEYLAAGKPVVATAIPECRLMAPYLDVVENRREFASTVWKRLEQPGSAEARRAFALTQTWEHRGADIAACIREIEGGE